jgi:hypothetical protein
MSYTLLQNYILNGYLFTRTPPSEPGIYWVLWSEDPQSQRYVVALVKKPEEEYVWFVQYFKEQSEEREVPLRFTGWLWGPRVELGYA